MCHVQATSQPATALVVGCCSLPAGKHVSGGRCGPRELKKKKKKISMDFVRDFYIFMFGAEEAEGNPVSFL